MLRKRELKTQIKRERERNRQRITLNDTDIKRGWREWEKEINGEIREK
jgi:hypothetical protein